MATQTLRKGFPRRRPLGRDLCQRGLHALRPSIHAARAARLTRLLPSTLYVDIFMVPKMAHRATSRLLCRSN